MKILFVINSFSVGGAEKLVYDLSLQLIGTDIKIYIVGLYKTNSFIEKQMCEELAKKGIRTYILDKRAKKDRLKSIYKIYKIIKNEKISIIHAHCRIPMLIGKIAGFFAHVPVVCTIHNTKGYCVNEEKLTSWLSVAYISIGQAAESYMMKELCIPHNKITCIYNGIDVHKIQKGKKDTNFWKQFGKWNQKDIALISVARIHPQKNHLCMLRAMAKLKEQNYNNYRLYLIGPYDKEDSFYKSLYDFVKKNNLKDHVYFLGAKNNVSDFFANADCFLMTSHYEGLSLSFLEAVISGIPIICTDLSFVHNLNKMSNCALIISQDDSDALVTMLIKKQFKKIFPNTQFFVQRFSIETCAKKHLELYRKVL